ncbi:hypothetical protein GCM10012275_31720 [Longimycelium tulufanense]|uniref:Uncharacterized protein n=1 Tax=Longimycelium tulufanense TaxID=907463 RepID=A0A8J3CEV0_9PSEU|nr:hypothetical protein GCM10012275_31720 [Longimycelium tulufanense]
MFLHATGDQWILVRLWASGVAPASPESGARPCPGLCAPAIDRDVGLPRSINVNSSLSG